MSRGGKEEIVFSESTQGWISYSATKRELYVHKKFADQLLSVVECSDRGKLLWLNDLPKEIKEEHLVHLLNVIKSLVK